MFYRAFFEKKYNESEAKLKCISEAYLNKIPQLARLLFLSSIQEKTFAPGESITTAG